MSKQGGRQSKNVKSPVSLLMIFAMAIRVVKAGKDSDQAAVYDWTALGASAGF